MRSTSVSLKLIAPASVSDAVPSVREFVKLTSTPRVCVSIAFVKNRASARFCASMMCPISASSGVKPPVSTMRSSMSIW